MSVPFTPSRRSLLAILAGAALCAMPMPALARRRRRGRDGDDDDGERALEAVQSGKAAPLSDILELVEEEVPGRVLEVEIDDEHGQLVYEIKVLSADGRYFEVYVDAAAKKILKVEEK